MTKATDVAKEIRKELKHQFPGTKFSVRTDQYSMGASIRIRWVDFPTPEAVKKAVQPFERVQRDQATGEILCGGNLFIFTENEWSSEIREEIEEAMPGNVQRDDWEYHHWYQKAAAQVYERYRGRIEAPTSTRTMKNPEGPATRRQKWALHKITGADTQEWKLTKAQASALINKAKKKENIKADLEALGLVVPEKQEKARQSDTLTSPKKKGSTKSLPHLVMLESFPDYSPGIVH